VPSLIAVYQNASGRRARSRCPTLGERRRPRGVIETTFRDECETDLFGEQVVLCGGLTR